MSESSLAGPAPAPVFVDQSGLRGRLLRGLGWPVSVIGAILAVAMGSSLIGVQADAPAMGIPAQPSRPSVPSRSPAPSLSPSPSSASSAARTATRSATPQAKTTATSTKTTATSTKNAAGASKTTTAAPRGAASSRQPTKHP
ncbi:hypothetical protein [Streptomyces sp. NPDC057686]|uniref:hypothetical protein n=1 Tax=Streptomyces sp. NPDC057686 TaxID=3346212 RepID=UPI003688CEAD